MKSDSEIVRARFADGRCPCCGCCDELTVVIGEGVAVCEGCETHDIAVGPILDMLIGVYVEPPVTPARAFGEMGVASDHAGRAHDRPSQAFEVHP